MEAGCVTIGCPPSRGEGWISFRFDFHSFAELSDESGDVTDSPVFLFNGNWWTVDICPGGDSDDEGDDNDDKRFVSIYMCNERGEGLHNNNTTITFEIKILYSSNFAGLKVIVNIFYYILPRS